MKDKLILKIESVNIRTLYKRPDNTYYVRVENWNFDKDCYNPSYDINFGLFSEAMNCVNFDTQLKDINETAL